MNNKENCYLKAFGVNEFEAVVQIIGGKWKLRIIYILAFNEVLRYGELKMLLKPITHKMLSAQLKELEMDGLLIRKAYAEVPPKVEYFLTDMAKDLEPLVKEMYLWIVKYNIGESHNNTEKNI